MLSGMDALSRSSEYAIRALTHMARDTPGEYQLVREMAETLDIPAPFLGKLLQPLVGLGVLESQRGRRGGFRLALDPAEVRLYDVVGVQEPLDGPRRCLLGQAICSDERACPTHEYWKKTSEEFLQLLLTTTIADLIAFSQSEGSCDYPLPVPVEP